MWSAAANFHSGNQKQKKNQECMREREREW